MFRFRRKLWSQKQYGPDVDCQKSNCITDNHCKAPGCSCHRDKQSVLGASLQDVGATVSRGCDFYTDASGTPQCGGKCGRAGQQCALQQTANGVECGCPNADAVDVTVSQGCSVSGGYSAPYSCKGTCKDSGLNCVGQALGDPKSPRGFSCTCPAVGVCVRDTCGNGVVDKPVEECDDGNTNNNDKCTDQCRWNPNYKKPATSTTTTTTVNTCTGDEVPVPDEYATMVSIVNSGTRNDDFYEKCIKCRNSNPEQPMSCNQESGKTPPSFVQTFIDCNYAIKVFDSKCMCPSHLPPVYCSEKTVECGTCSDGKARGEIFDGFECPDGWTSAAVFNPEYCGTTTTTTTTTPVNLECATCTDQGVSTLEVFDGTRCPEGWTPALAFNSKSCLGSRARRQSCTDGAVLNDDGACTCPANLAFKMCSNAQRFCCVEFEIGDQCKKENHGCPYINNGGDETYHFAVECTKPEWLPSYCYKSRLLFHDKDGLCCREDYGCAYRDKEGYGTVCKGYNDGGAGDM